MSGQVTAAVNAWLIALARASAGAPIDDAMIRNLFQVVRDGVPEIAPVKLDEEWLRRCGLFSLPRILMHGDLSPNNIIATDDGCFSAVDWEFGTAHGFPLVDLIDFLLYVNLAETGDYRACWSSLFGPAASGAARSSIAAYCDALGITPAAASALAMIFVLVKIRLLMPMTEKRARRKLQQLVEICRTTDFRTLGVA